MALAPFAQPPNGVRWIFCIAHERRDGGKEQLVFSPDGGGIGQLGLCRTPLQVPKCPEKGKRNTSPFSHGWTHKAVDARKGRGEGTGGMGDKVVRGEVS